VSGRLYARTSRLHDVSLYPVPDWRPNGGLTVDRALVLAVMRQESAYQHNVVSRAGARGLMQLMPATAAMVANDRGLRGGEVNRLFEPELNIELGQRFLKQLIERDTIRGNLMFVAASYNAGEGALARWRMRDDPLLFIAAIPYRETRDYVHRVMYNMAAYRLRFNQGHSELDQMVRGQWPTYRALDGQSTAGGAETLR
jgi:soluble lytic murein transglycosylase-like protein